MRQRLGIGAGAFPRNDTFYFYDVTKKMLTVQMESNGSGKHPQTRTLGTQGQPEVCRSFASA
jgi:hypothetical protein